MEGFIRILELINVYFKNVLLISHLDSLKDCVDMQIVIEKEAGFAKGGSLDNAIVVDEKKF